MSNQKKALPDTKAASRRVRAWMLRKYPTEKPYIGNFRTDVTFAEINRRMHEGDDFYEICNCGESFQRERVFEELARIYRTDYGYWYYLWLDGAREHYNGRKEAAA